MPFPSLASNVQLNIERPISANLGRNLLPNPSGENGGHGWLPICFDTTAGSPEPAYAATVFAVATGGPGGIGLRFGPGTGVTAARDCSLVAQVPVTVGKTLYMSGLYHGLLNFASGSPAVRVRYADADGNFLATVHGGALPAASNSTRWAFSGVVPAGAVTAFVYLYMTHTTPGTAIPNTARMDVSELTLVEYTTTPGTLPLPYYPRPNTSTNVLGEMHEIVVTRDPQAGTLTAVMVDPVLGGETPATFFVRGYRAQLASGSEPIFTGVVDTVHSQRLIQPDGSTRLQVTLTAVDAMATLAGHRLMPAPPWHGAIRPTLSTTRLTGYSADAITRTIGDLPVPWLIEVSSNPATAGITHQPGTETVWDALPVDDVEASALVRAWGARHTCHVWPDRRGRLRVSHLDRTFEATVPSWTDDDLLVPNTLIGDNTDQSYSAVAVTLRNWSTALSQWNSSTYVVTDGAGQTAPGQMAPEVVILSRASDVTATVGSRGRNWLKGGIRRHIAYQTALDITGTGDITTIKALIDLGNRVTTPDFNTDEDAASAGVAKRVVGLRHHLVARPVTEGGSFWIMEVDLAIDPRFM